MVNIVEIDVLTVMLTNKCILQCDHCGPISGPHNPLRKIFFSEFDGLLEVVRERGCKLVNFSGGEPFLYSEQLTPLVNVVSNRGIVPRITTSGYWGLDDRKKKLLGNLAEAGLKQIFLSATEFHYKFITLEHTLGAARMAQDLGIQVALVIGTTKSKRVSQATIRNAFVKAELPLPTMVESPIIPVGRGKHLQESLLYLTDRIKLNRPCPSVLRNPTIQSDGTVTPCASAFSPSSKKLVCGNLARESLTDIVEKMNRNTLFRLLHTLGPYRLMIDVEHTTELGFPKSYVNICHLCHELLETLDLDKHIFKMETIHPEKSWTV